jgi:hypothetical protein
VPSIRRRLPRRSSSRCVSRPDAARLRLEFEDGDVELAESGGVADHLDLDDPVAADHEVEDNDRPLALGPHRADVTPSFVSFKLGEGSSTFGLYVWNALAADSGVAPDASEGFRGVVLSYIVDTNARVDEVLAQADRAGGTIVKPARQEQWGGYGGNFSDPDGFIWKVVSTESYARG